jgi:hypothetical protein
MPGTTTLTLADKAEASHGGRMLTRSAIAPIALSLWAVAGCSRPVQVVSAGDVSGDVIPATANVLPVGTTLEVQLDQPISATQSRVGDRFTAHVTKPVVAQNGAVAVPAGAIVEGRVTGIEPSRDPTRPALIRLDFETLRVGDRGYPFTASVERTAIPGRSDEDLKKKAGTGAVVGGVLGAVLGRDLTGLVVGGAIGAAAGTLISLGMDRTEARLPEGTHLTLRNDRRMALR